MTVTETFFAPPSTGGTDEPWHIFHLDGDAFALCGYRFKGEVPSDEPSDEDTCPACLVLAEIPCDCGACE